MITKNCRVTDSYRKRIATCDQTINAKKAALQQEIDKLTAEKQEYEGYLNELTQYENIVSSMFNDCGNATLTKADIVMRLDKVLARLEDVDSEFMNNAARKIGATLEDAENGTTEGTGTYNGCTVTIQYIPKYNDILVDIHPVSYLLTTSSNESKTLTEDQHQDALGQVIVDYIHDTFGSSMSSLGMQDKNTIYFECEKDFDSEDGLNFDDFQSDIRCEFEDRFDLEFELEDANTALIHIVIPNWDNDDQFEWFVEQEIEDEGRCKYCALTGELPNVKLLWVSQEWMDERIATQICQRASEWLVKTAESGVHVDAVMYCRDTPDEKYTASFTVGQSIEITKPLTQLDEDDVAERVKNYLEHQPHPYKNTDPDDAEDVCEKLSEYLFGISYDKLEASYALYDTVYNWLEDNFNGDIDDDI